MKELCEKVLAIITDYRQDELGKLNVAHVQRWVEQFPCDVREPILAEIAHILSKTYVAKNTMKRFLEGIVTEAEFVGDDPKVYWRGVHFLRLQQAGNSQRDMLTMFDGVLQENCGLSIDQCGARPHTYVYLDDSVFSGGRVKSDLSRWIESEAPKESKVAVLTIAIHSLGEFFAGRDIEKAAAGSGKKVNIEWWRALTIEDRKFRMTDSDVLRPTAIPQEAQAYVDSLHAAPILRTGSNIGPLKLFSSGEARHLVEQEFLKAGIQVRRLCPRLPVQMRPLGSTLMHTTGFGSMLVTYRNCANNTPLVLWAGDPWYPLFPRRTN